MIPDLSYREKNLTRYLNEIRTLPLIKTEEEVSLAKRIKNNDAQALSELVKANLRFVISIAKNYRNRGLSLNDLINEGNLGLIEAARRFDDTRGYKFISYAVWWIRQRILQAIQENSRVIRLPQNKIRDIKEFHRAYGRLEQKLEGEPSELDIEQELNMSSSDLGELFERSNNTISLDSMLNEESASTLLGKISAADDDSAEKQLEREALKDALEGVFKTLTEREKETIKLHYGIDCSRPHTLAEISTRFGITRERVRQIKERALSKMRCKSRTKSLQDFI